MTGSYLGNANMSDVEIPPDTLFLYLPSPLPHPALFVLPTSSLWDGTQGKGEIVWDHDGCHCEAPTGQAFPLKTTGSASRGLWGGVRGGDLTVMILQGDLTVVLLVLGEAEPGKAGGRVPMA